MKKVYLILSTLALSCSGFLSCADSDAVGDNYSTFTGQMIADYLTENADRYSDFIYLLDKAGAWPLLESYGKYTVFAPTNEAIETYYMEKGDGVHPMNIDTLNAKDLKKLVYYHIIDGETNSTKAYSTFDFETGAIPTRTMIGRYLMVYFPEGAASTAWQINELANISLANLEMINGVVHEVDHILEANSQMLPDLIESQTTTTADGTEVPKYSIYTAALAKTGLAGKMRADEDVTYVCPTSNPDGTAVANNRCYPESKKIAWTALLESDETLAAVNDAYTAAAGIDGIHSVEDMEKYARAVYRELEGSQYESGVPVDLNLGDADVKNPRHPLYHFVAYHFLKAGVRTDNFTMRYSYLSEFNETGTCRFEFNATRLAQIKENGNYRVENFWQTLADGTLINTQKGNIINTLRNPIYESGLANSDEVIHFDVANSNKECQNGYLHELNHVMAYNAYVETAVLNRRLRLDFRVFLPELVTNDVVTDNNSKGHTNFLPDGYCENMNFTEERPSIYCSYDGGSMHPYFLGDNLNLYGFFDASFMVGPIPAGNYEVRFGYHVEGATKATSHAGITQFYFDGTPCGIPLDMRNSAIDGAIGWKEAYDIRENYYTVESAAEETSPDDYYGYENDKSLRNRNFMKAPDSFMGYVYYNNTRDKSGWEVLDWVTARETRRDLRYILGTFDLKGENRMHKLRVVQMMKGMCQLDYIEFIPTSQLRDEDTH